MGGFSKAVGMLNKYVVKEVVKEVRKGAEKWDDEVCHRNEQEKKEIREIRRRIHG